MGVEEFRKYCKNNKGRISYNGNSREESPEHKKLVRSVASNPQNYLSGIGRVAESYIEVELAEDDGATISSVDIVFFTQHSDVVICELKASDLTGRGATSQLEKQYDFIMRKFNLPTKRISLQKKSTGKIRQTLIMPKLKDLQT